MTPVFSTSSLGLIFYSCCLYPTGKQNIEKTNAIPLAEESDEGSKDSLESFKESSILNIKNENEIKLESKGQDCKETPSSNKLESINFEKSSEQGSLNFPTSKTWAKLPNGITSYSSSESGSPEHSTSDNDMEPASKKIKLENETDLGTENIKRLLEEDVEHKSPAAAPHSKGSSSCEEQEEIESNKEDRENEVKDSDDKEKNDSGAKNSSGW